MINHLNSVVLLAILLLGSCSLPVQLDSSPVLNLKLVFQVQGRPAAVSPSRSQAPGSRLLLPTASSLTVTITPLDAGLDTPAPQKVSIDASAKTRQEVPVSFKKLAVGHYSIEALAVDGNDTPVFRQKVADFRLGSGSTALVLNLVPVTSDAGGFPALATATATTGSQAAGSSRTWIVPGAALVSGGFGLSLDADSSLLLFAQYADGPFINSSSADRMVSAQPASGTSASESLVTIYNSGSVDSSYRLILNPVVVNYLGNGSTGGSLPPSRGYIKDDAFTVADLGDLVKTDGVFLSWNTAADGSGTSSLPGDTVTITATSGVLNFYAIWADSACTVSFNSLGGSAVAPVAATYNQIITSPTAPTMAGHSFGGWYKEIGCTTPWVFASEKVTSSMTLYAKWTIDSYPVTFNSQGGSVVADASVNYGATISSPAAPALASFSFGGWFKEPACTNAWNFATDTVTSAITLYAQWLPGSLSISLNNPSDPSVTFAGGTPTLDRKISQAITVTASDGSYANYHWTIAGTGTVPLLGANGASSVTITAQAGTTSLEVFTVTLWFGDGAAGQYQYSKSFAIQAIEN